MADFDTSPDTVGTRERIIDVATKLFAEQGFAAVSVRDIASAADVSLPTVYRHFTDKRALYLQSYDGLLQKRTAHYRQFLFKKADPAVKLLTFVHELYRDLAEHPSYSRLLHREIADQNAIELRYLADRAFKENFIIVADVCSQLQSRMSSEEATFSIFSLAVGLSALKILGQASMTIPLQWNNNLFMSRFLLGLVISEVDWARVRIMRKNSKTKGA